MKRLIKVFLIVLVVFIYNLKMSYASKDHNNINQQKSDWYLPDYFKFQYAGNIGYMSLGLGYNWWSEKAQSDLLYGYVPHSRGNASIHTFTVKNTFRLYTFNVFNKYNLSPIFGFSLSFEPGENSYMRIPERYPDGYYTPNSYYACFNLGLKTKVMFDEDSHFSAIELYAELNTLADYIYYNIAAKEDKSAQVLSLALGVNMYF